MILKIFVIQKFPDNKVQSIFYTHKLLLKFYKRSLQLFRRPRVFASFNYEIV